MKRDIIKQVVGHQSKMLAKQTEGFQYGTMRIARQEVSGSDPITRHRVFAWLHDCGLCIHYRYWKPEGHKKMKADTEVYVISHTRTGYKIPGFVFMSFDTAKRALFQLARISHWNYRTTSDAGDHYHKDRKFRNDIKRLKDLFREESVDY